MVTLIVAARQKVTDNNWLCPGASMVVQHRRAPGFEGCPRVQTLLAAALVAASVVLIALVAGMFAGTADGGQRPVIESTRTVVTNQSGLLSSVQSR